MKLLSDPASLNGIHDEAMRQVIGERFAQLSEYGLPLQDMAQFWLMEAGDTALDIEAKTGRPVIAGWPSGNAAFQPAWDVLASHPSCFEMVFVTEDSGFGQVYWIPKSDLDPVLRQLCGLHAQ